MHIYAMNSELKKQIFNKIKEYDKIIISRHSRPDGDAVGSTKGLKELITASFPEKKVYLSNEDTSEYLSFLGGEDGILEDKDYRNALVIVIDTATLDRISNSKVSLGAELIKIDHHIETAPYGDISWIEEERSSACEMIADFYMSFSNELKLTKDAAKFIYTGMVTDSGRFKYAVTGETLRCASVLIDCGIDAEALYAQLYLEDFKELQFKSLALEQLRMTENGVAYLYISQALQKKLELTGEQASNSVSFIDSIKGSIIWLAFIENENGSVRVRLRSRFVTVNKLAEKYHGGGHAKASGATVYSDAEMQALLDDADELIRNYKKNNTGWI